MLGMMLLLQAVCWLLAKGLGRRLERSVIVCGWLAPLVVLAPWLARSSELLVPCDILANVPGAPAIEFEGRWSTWGALGSTIDDVAGAIFG